MKVVFAGTPEFAACALSALIEAGHEIVLVLTRPDRPAGRGMKLQPSAVKRLALEHGLALYQPERLRDTASHEPIRAAGPEVMVVAAYGLILPQPVLDIPERGCLNIHASLLPRWRGAAPIQRAIEAGDAETGISIMYMEAGLDTGPLLLAEALPIENDDNAASLHDKLAAMGARLIVSALSRIDELSATAQSETGVTYARKIEKHEAAIDWRRTAKEIGCQVRAFNPMPGTVGTINDMPLKVWRAAMSAGEGRPGLVLSAGSDGIVVACGEGAIRLVELQRAGGRRLAAEDFLAGFPIAAGESFDLARN